MAKSKVVLLQQPNGMVNGVRIDGQEIAVAHAGPVVMNGSMGVTLTISDVEISAEVVEETAPKASGAKTKG
jgi:hypothetical protein